MTRPRAYWPELLIILLFFASRTAALTALPLHNDEGLHLTRAIQVWNGHPFYDIGDGKILGVWLIAAFYPQVSPVFVARIATVFVSALGLAAGIALARLASKRRSAALLVGLLWLVSPYLFFFERMALADIEAGVAVVVLTLALLPGVRITRRSTIIAGIALGAALLFKVSTAPFIGIPVLSVLLARNIPWRTRITRLITVYAIAFIMFAPAALYSATRNGFFSIARSWIGGPQMSIVVRTTQNSATFADTLLTVNGLWTLALIGVPFSLLAGRRGLYILGSVAGPLLVMVVFGTEVMDRHFGAIMPLLTVVAAVGLTQLTTWSKKDSRRSDHPNKVLGRLAIVGGAALALIWGWFWAYRPAYFDPPNFPLTQPMREQYITLFPSGYGLREAVSALPTTVGPHTVIGSMTDDGCRRAVYYLPAGPSLDCVGLGQSEAQIKQMLDKTGVAYVLAENPPIGLDPAAVQATWTQIAVYPRPGNLSRVTLWKVIP